MLIMRYENSDKISCNYLLTGTFCSKVKHKNLVELHGVLKSPFSLVMEFIPHGDLFRLFSQDTLFNSLGLKWRLKMAIDIARAMR
jgi:serine/threonine protein kinase